MARPIPLSARPHFSTGELARWLGIYHEKVIRLIHAGKIDATRSKARARFRIPAEEAARLLIEAGVQVPGVWPRDIVLLLVDDDARVCRIVKHYFRLHRVPIEVEDLESVEDALARLARPPAPRLVVFDWKFPGDGRLQGIDAVRRLGAAPTTRDIPVILMSATDPDAAGAAVRHHGLIDFIRKPLILEDFKNRIWKHVFGTDRRVNEKRKPMQAEIPG